MRKHIHPKEKEILKDLSSKYNLSLEAIEEIVTSQYGCAQEYMKKGEHGKPETFKNINFIHLYKLVAKKKRVEFIQSLSDSKKGERRRKKKGEE